MNKIDNYDNHLLDRIECIVVNKVYNSCYQIEELSKDTTVLLGPSFPGPINPGDIIPCSLNGPIVCTVINKTPISKYPGFFSFVFLVTVPLRLTNPNDSIKFHDFDLTFTKTATLCCPEGTALDCDKSSLLASMCLAVS